MSDATSTSTTSPDQATAAPTGHSAGAILRAARQAQGIHIAALAASMKVAQKKLEALEGDRIDELPDATFARALAKTVCRTLKIDSAPVLALLPQQQFTGRLEHVSEGINEPFRDHGGRHHDGDWGRARSPAIWLPALILIAAIGVFMAPQGLFLRLLPASGGAAGAASGGASRAASESTPLFPPADGASAADASTEAPPATPVTTASAPSAVVAAAAFAASVADAAASTVSRVAAAASVEASALAGVGPVQLHARGESWVQVQDANAKVLIGRAMAAGETVFLEGPAPLRVKIGNAAETELVYRGRPVDLTASTRDNVARLELK